MLAIACPGQGSQIPGFLSPWLELPGVREHLAQLSEVARLDLAVHGTRSDEETIKDTAVAQPLIVAAGLIAARALLDTAGTGTTVRGDTARADNAGADSAGAAADRQLVVAGHSVGEITASALTGALSPVDAMTFVRERADAMAKAADAVPTGMSAVVGGDPDEVLAAIKAAGLTPANANGAGQTVAAGTFDQLRALAENPPAKARVISLKVAGAFHTRHMAPAVAALQALRPSLSPADPRVALLSNFDGGLVTSGAANLDSLIAQVSRPVRWDLCMQTMLAMGVTGLIELPPAGTLAGLAKRGMRAVERVTLTSPEDLDAARSLLAEHGAAVDGATQTETAGRPGFSSPTSSPDNHGQGN